MSYCAYYGDPEGRIWGRVEFRSEDAYRMAVWNDGSLYGGHRTDEETEFSRMWARQKEDNDGEAS